MMLLGIGFLVASFFSFRMLLGVIIIAVISIICHLWTPRAFEISDDLKLRVYYRLGSRQFGKVLKCRRITESICGGVRLCGNGGLFAVTGWFWARKYGKFRMYSTSVNYKDLVMLEANNQKIMISPEHPDAWMSDCALLELPSE